MDEIYMNKNGFKCVRGQLAKTDGRDPQEYEEVSRRAKHDGLTPEQHKAEVQKLKVRAADLVE